MTGKTSSTKWDSSGLEGLEEPTRLAAVHSESKDVCHMAYHLLTSSAGRIDRTCRTSHPDGHGTR
jgi:hypothetical protein